MLASRNIRVVIGWTRMLTSKEPRRRGSVEARMRRFDVRSSSAKCVLCFVVVVLYRLGEIGT